MHTGEEYFFWSWQQYVMICVFIAAYLYLAGIEKLPSMEAFKRFADTINSAGGHIIILVCLTVYAIKITMQLFYHVISLDSSTFTKAQAIISMGTSFSTGTLVGLPLGALLKTMTGGYNMPKESTSSATTSVTTSPTNGGTDTPPAVPMPIPPRVT